MKSNMILVIVGIIGLAFLGFVYFTYASSFADLNAQYGSPVDAKSVSANSQFHSSQQVQDVYLRALQGGTYDKSELRVKKGVPVRLHFSTDSGVGCGAVLVIRQLGVQVYSKNGGEAETTFTPQVSGEYKYSCTMNMFKPGTLIVE